MPTTKYVGYYEVNILQFKIMKFVDFWVHKKKTPVPRCEIIKDMQSQGVNMPTTRNALYSLIRKGYIREAITISNKTSYVALRSVM
jgi:hypothetical protein